MSDTQGAMEAWVDERGDAFVSEKWWDAFTEKARDIDATIADLTARLGAAEEAREAAAEAADKLVETNFKLDRENHALADALREAERKLGAAEERAELLGRQAADLQRVIDEQHKASYRDGMRNLKLADALQRVDRGIADMQQWTASHPRAKVSKATLEEWRQHIAGGFSAALAGQPEEIQR